MILTVFMESEKANAILLTRRVRTLAPVQRSVMPGMRQSTRITTVVPHWLQMKDIRNAQLTTHWSAMASRVKALQTTSHTGNTAAAHTALSRLTGQTTPTIRRF